MLLQTAGDIPKPIKLCSAAQWPVAVVVLMAVVAVLVAVVVVVVVVVALRPATNLFSKLLTRPLRESAVAFFFDNSPSWQSADEIGTLHGGLRVLVFQSADVFSMIPAWMMKAGL